MSKLRRLFSLVLAGLAALVALSPAVAADRVALVIGSNDYLHAPKLNNAVSDAHRIADVLKRIGFDVSEIYDADQSVFSDAMDSFAAKAENAQIALVYYAGHGIQYQGDVYLVPVDIDLANARDLRKTVPADYLIRDASAAGELGIVILDACRNSPFVKKIAEDLGPTRSMAVSRGLTRIEDVPTKSLVAYSTQAGNVALDGTGGNSPYATALVHNLPTPNKDVRLIFGAVRDEVVKATEGKQEPYVYGSLGGGEVYLSTSSAAPADDADLGKLDIPDIANAASLPPDYVAWKRMLRADRWPAINGLAAAAPGSLFAAIGALLAQRQAAYTRPSAALADARNEPFLLKRLSKQAVAAVQVALRDLDYISEPADGVAGPKTEQAFDAFSEAELGGAVTFASLVTLAERADTRPAASPLTGTWSGRYEYPDETKPGVDFSQRLTVSQGLVSGFISEPNTFGDNTSKNLYATFEGTIDGNEIVWTKTYDGTAGVSHSVVYRGVLDRRTKTIEGTWTVPGSWSGTFTLALQ